MDYGRERRPGPTVPRHWQNIKRPSNDKPEQDRNQKGLFDKRALSARSVRGRPAGGLCDFSAVPTFKSLRTMRIGRKYSSGAGRLRQE